MVPQRFKVKFSTLFSIHPQSKFSFKNQGSEMVEVKEKPIFLREKL